MERVGEPNFLGYLLDKQITLLQSLGRMNHLKPLQKLVWTLAVITTKKPAQIGVVRVTLRGNLLQGFCFSCFPG